MGISKEKYDSLMNAVEYFCENKDKSITYVAKVFNLNRGTLGKKLFELEIKGDRRKSEFDEEYFNIIDSEEKAYWLGFILADGCINRKLDRLSLKLSIKDSEHVEKFKRCIKSQKKTYIETTKINNKEYKRVTIKLASKSLVKDLINLGIRPCKSMKECCSENIETEFIRDYIRGIFDGDGWFSKNTNSYEVGVGMSKEALVYIRKCLEEFANIKRYEISKYKNIFRYRITSKFEIIKFFNYVYKDSKIYLDRKFQKIEVAVLGWET
ncbi:MAG: LAGLIDADG family homing endonuclease [Clostridium sp.]